MTTIPVWVDAACGITLPGATTVAGLTGIGEDAVVVAAAGTCRSLDPAWARDRCLIVLGHADGSGPEPFAELPVRPPRHMLERAVASAVACIEHRREGRQMAQRLAEERSLRHELLEIGAALSSERDLGRLLERILRSARTLVNADAGSLYFSTGAGSSRARLRFVLAQNDSRPVPRETTSLAVDHTSIAGMVAATRRPLRIDDVDAIPPDAPYAFNRRIDRSTGYRTHSVLAVPMTDRQGTLIGVLQLINRKRHADARLDGDEVIRREVVPFTGRDEDLLRALAAQAAVAVANSRLVREVEDLFDAFVHALVAAIEQRDPPTSGHSARVAATTVALARAVEQNPPAVDAPTTFNTDEIRQLRYAALLHDVGKLGVRERVLTKRAKLYPYQDDVIRERFLHATCARKLRTVEAFLDRLSHGGHAPNRTALARLDDDLDRIKAEMRDALDTVLAANDPASPPDGRPHRLEALARQSFPGPDGEPRPLLESQEVALLSLREGNLDEAERGEIESHVVYSTRFLETLPWPASLSRVPRIVALHHEKLDGSGYPAGLTAPDIPLEARMLTIADIFDALTASDRPYRASIPPERALSMLDDEARRGALDASLVALFARSGAWRAGR